MKYLILFVSIVILSVSCTDDPGECLHCNNDDDNGNGNQDQKSFTAEISGDYSMNIASDNLSYIHREISGNVIVELSVNGKIDGKDFQINITVQGISGSGIFHFSSDDANVLVTIIDDPPKYYQHNQTGSITVYNADENNFSAHFNFTVSMYDPESYISVNSAIVNYKR